MRCGLSDIRAAFERGGYCSNDKIDYATWVSVLCDRPLLIEGEPGVGKTAVARALSDGLGLPLIRLQMYEGLTDDKVLYDYDYPRQLLTLEAVKPQIERDFGKMGTNDAIRAVAGSLDFYGPEFLVRRPVLRSITSDVRCVLLIDEIDKAPEEIEYMLYEFLEDYSITIPQYGRIECPDDRKPIVVITSNGYRELSGALRRRCNYLYIDRKGRDELIEIIKVRANADDGIAEGVARCMESFGRVQLQKQPSVSEAIEYARFLQENRPVTRELALGALGIIAKSQRDVSQIRRLVDRDGAVLWQA